MGTYIKDVDYQQIMNDIRFSFYYYCIELQLVWLAELLILHYYTLCKNTMRSYIRSHRDYDVFTPRKVSELLRASDKPYQVYNDLVKFRNIYVHSGSQAAFSIFRDLCNNHKLELIELARIVDVNLNFNCVLYRILEKREL